MILPHAIVSLHTATSESGKRQDGSLEDDIGLHLDFGRRFIYLFLRSAAADTACTSSAASARRSLSDAE